MTTRSAQMLTAALTALLVVLVGATIFVILTRGPVGPTPTPSLFAFESPGLASPAASSAEATAVTASPAPGIPTAGSSAPPATSVFETPTPPSSTGPTFSPTPKATRPPTPTPPPPTPTPTPTPQPTVNPTAPQQAVQFDNVGLDQSCGNLTPCGSVPRILTFNVDGQSKVEAIVSDSTGPVRLCIWTEAVDDQRECHTVHNGGFSKLVTSTNSSVWHVSVIGAQVTASATLNVEFNANSPSVSIDNFRYLGASMAEYNGFDAELTTNGDGSIRVQAAFDDGSQGSYDWHLVMSSSGSPVHDQTGGPDPSIDESQSVSGGTTYVVSLHDPDNTANGTMSVFVSATISWP